MKIGKVSRVPKLAPVRQAWSSKSNKEAKSNLPSSNIEADRSYAVSYKDESGQLDELNQSNNTNLSNLYSSGRINLQNSHKDSYRSQNGHEQELLDSGAFVPNESLGMYLKSFSPSEICKNMVMI